MVIYDIFKADLITSYRVFIDRTFSSTVRELRLGDRVFNYRFPKGMTVFFIIVSLMAINLTVTISLFLNTQDLTDPHILIDGGTFAMFFFMVIFLRVMLYTYRKVLKAGELHYIFSIPLRIRDVIIAKYLANVVYIFTQLFTGYVLFIIIMYLHGINTWIPLSYLVEGLLLIFLACSLGFSIPIFLQERSFIKKITYLGAHAAVISAITIPIRYTPSSIRGIEYISLLGLTTALTFIVVLATEKVLLDAWIAQISKPFKFIRKTRDAAAFGEVERSEFYIGEKEMLIAKKDLIFFIREKDVLSTIVASVALLFVMFGLYNFIGPHGNIQNEFNIYVYPMIIALALFLGATLQCSLIGLASISMEGKPFWILKSLPVSGSTVLKGKSLAILTLAIPTVILIPIPLSILDGFPIFVSSFFFIEALVLVVAFTGIGIWSGSKMPNFDETMRNMPDLMSQFSITFISAFVALLLFAVPAYLLTQSHLIGIVAAVDSLGWALVIYLVGIDLGKDAYDNIGSDLYM